MFGEGVEGVAVTLYCWWHSSGALDVDVVVVAVDVVDVDGYKNMPSFHCKKAS